jgi:Domain of unknown function (DUF4389)
MYVSAQYPVRVEGRLEQPSRALWLVKWLLVLPHYVVLAFLWIAFAVLTAIAFVMVLFTGRYPRGIFDFNVGVLRWTWRVAFYAYGANGTDRYPPFTLGDAPDYPARLEIRYPEQQRRGLPLIGWWLLGIPHYMIAGVFVGGGGVAWATGGQWAGGASGFGLTGLLVLVGALVLLFRGVYPRELFDFVLGLNRWALRVAAYAAVMTPVYPPFRLDVGEDEPGEFTIALPVERTASATRWGGGRTLAAVCGSLAVLVAAGALVGGAVSVVFDQTQRDHAGYLMTGSHPYSTATYALVSTSYRGGTSRDAFVARDMLGTVRISTESQKPLFVGIARTGDVTTYLRSVRRAVSGGFDAHASGFKVVGTAPPPAAPGVKGFWAAKAVGSGPLTLTWAPQNGSWRVVVMNADASAGVHTSLSIGARFPHLLWIGIGLLGGAALLGLLGGGLLYAATNSTRRRER